MNNDDNQAALEDINKKVSRHMIDECNRIIDFYEKTQGAEFARQLTISFIARFIGSVIYKNLKAKPTDLLLSSPEEIREYKVKSFSELKNSIQDANAAAFQGAMSSFTGRMIEYYCQIKAVPEPINHERPC